MAYSRWGKDNRWYTYWCVQDKNNENRDTAIFEICTVISFSAKQLRDDIKGCLEIAKIKENKNSKIEYQVTDKEIDKLKHYMNQFLKSVGSVYPKKIKNPK